MTSTIDPATEELLSAATCAYRCDSRSHERRGARWAAIVYVALALATPIIVYAGPDVMSPAVPVIADAAAEGHLALRPYISLASIVPFHAHCALQ